MSVEAALPEPYQGLDPHPGPVRAWAALLEPAEQGLRLAACAPGGDDRTDLPADLATLRFLTGAAPQWRQHGWLWSRHG